MNCMCIQTELDRLTDMINKEYSNLNIPKYTVKNPYDFTDKTPLKEITKPNLGNNFCICKINGDDYIQFTKKINDKKVSYKRAIKSYDLQKEFDNFIDYLNDQYKLNIEKRIIEDLNDWKTTNKIK